MEITKTMPYSYTSIYLDHPIQVGRAIDIFLPDAVTQDIAVFFVHGGGWHAGGRADCHALMQAFNAEGFICASIDYRLAGINIFDQLTDCRHGYDVFISQLRSLRRPAYVCMVGGSAGAHLASLLAMTRPGACNEPLTFLGRGFENQWVCPIGAAFEAATVRFEPWNDISPPIWTSMQNIVAAPYTKHPELYRLVSPMTHISAQTPPILFLHGENEHMFPLEHKLEFIAQVKGLGGRAECKIYTRAEHGFFYDVTRRQQKEAFADVLAFIQSLCPSGGMA
jgi:acetyl esterase/lipase